jgi:hypothetical protein
MNPLTTFRADALKPLLPGREFSTGIYHLDEEAIKRGLTRLLSNNRYVDINQKSCEPSIGRYFQLQEGYLNIGDDIYHFFTEVLYSPVTVITLDDINDVLSNRDKKWYSELVPIIETYDTSTTFVHALDIYGLWGNKCCQSTVQYP